MLWDSDPITGTSVQPHISPKIFQVLKHEGTKEPYKRLFWGVAFPLLIIALHTANICEDSSNLGT